jgi:hypothetical protein
MKKLSSRRITLCRETLVQLEKQALQSLPAVAGASMHEGTQCTICNYTVCVTC